MALLIIELLTTLCLSGLPVACNNTPHTPEDTAPEVTAALAEAPTEPSR